MDANRQMAELGIFVHGVLAGFHLLGVVYNARRANWFDVTMHSAATIYDGWAVHKHIRQYCGEIEPSAPE